MYDTLELRQPASVYWINSDYHVGDVAYVRGWWHARTADGYLLGRYSTRRRALNAISRQALCDFYQPAEGE